MKRDELEKFPAGTHIPLPKQANWPESIHIVEDAQRCAIKAALNAGRPLLIRGEPGVGKSQLARAAAYMLRRPFLPFVITAATESSDLLWRFDAIARLGEAQLLGAQRESNANIGQDLLNPERFLSPGVLWWAIDWIGAEAAWNKSKKGFKPQEPEQWTPPLPPADNDDRAWRPEDGCVVLIDEIDKADSELPNSFLEVLGNWSFSVPYLEPQTADVKSGHRTTNEVSRPDSYTKPLIVITTNEERELPAAFIRRCLVMKMSLPMKEQELKNWFVRCGQAHFPQKVSGGTEGAKHMKFYPGCSREVLTIAADAIIKDRKDAVEKTLPAKPGLAEYLDFVAAAVADAQDERESLKALKDVEQFILGKHIMNIE
jgi:MoxR-like ATPase